MKERQQNNAAAYPILILLINATDHITGMAGLTPTVQLSKNGVAFGAASGSITEVGAGWYKFAPTAADLNTLGELTIHATATGADPYDEKYVVVPWNPFAIQLSQYFMPGIVSTATSTTIVATGGFSATDQIYNNSLVVMTSGALLGISLPIASYAGSTQTFTLGKAFPNSVVPSAGDTFAVLGYHI